MPHCTVIEDRNGIQATWITWLALEYLPVARLWRFFDAKPAEWNEAPLLWLTAEPLEPLALIPAFLGIDR